MNLIFSLQEMKDILDRARLQTNIYTEAIGNIDTCINNIENYWVSKETGTYEEFKNKYDSQKKQLLDAKEYMEEFCRRLEGVIINYEEASNDIKNSFE